MKDVFCPRKRDQTGSLFGFVRFPKDYHAEVILEKLNNIWIKSFKLRAWVPRFRREPIPQKLLRASQRNAFPEGYGMRIGNKSFVDTAKGKPALQEEEGKVFTWDKNQEIISFKTKDEDKKWLEECYSGYLKPSFSWEDHGEELLSESSGILYLRPMGGNLILIQSANDKKTEDVLFDFDEWTSFWFEWIRPWKDIDVNNNRKVWTLWYGVPYHAWSLNFFSLICAQVGSFVKFDEKTELKQNLEVARVLVSSSSLSHINRVLSIKIDGKVFAIRVLEESPCACNFPKEEEEDDESESQWEKESENENVTSLRPAKAMLKGGESDSAAVRGGSYADKGSDCSVDIGMIQTSKKTVGPTSNRTIVPSQSNAVNIGIISPRKSNVGVNDVVGPRERIGDAIAENNFELSQEIPYEFNLEVHQQDNESPPLDNLIDPVSQEKAQVIFGPVLREEAQSDIAECTSSVAAIQLESGDDTSVSHMIKTTLCSSNNFGDRDSAKEGLLQNNQNPIKINNLEENGEVNQISVGKIVVKESSLGGGKSEKGKIKIV